VWELGTTFRESVFIVPQIKFSVNNTDGGLRMLLVCTVVFSYADPWRPVLDFS